MVRRSWMARWGILNASCRLRIPAATIPSIWARSRRPVPSKASPCSSSVAATAQSVTEPARLPGISVFLPCHNEEGNVERVVHALDRELPKVSDRYEIIVVNDGSRDRTGEIADRLAAANPHVKVVHHPVNRGYGGAVTSGIHACSQPWVVLCDGDGQFEASDIARLAAKTPQCDVVVGYRSHRADPLMRKVNGKAW